MILPDAPWRHMPGIGLLLNALGSGEALTRVVGGAVRDGLAGQPVTDVDLATSLSPQDVMARLASARIKSVPTGIAHGTVTAVLSGGPVEITTLRRDVSTDGRRATVAFTDDWKEDAARRDFTINALYADPETGEIFDYFGGADDLAAGVVRFIGDPLQRIAEDHLRIMRFFRFHARFGRGAPDAEGLAACTARANDLMALSRERIADELLKILALPLPAETIDLMFRTGIFKPVLPEITNVQPLCALVAAEVAAKVVLSAHRRFSALLPADPALAGQVAHRLKLSKAVNNRLVSAAARSLGDAADPQALTYRLGKESATDRLLLLGDVEAVEAIRDWQIPVFPLSGGAIVARGVQAGPDVARILKAVETQWISEGFPNTARVDAIADAHTA